MQATRRKRWRAIMKTVMLAGSLIVGLAPAMFAQAAPQTAAGQCRLDATSYQNKKFSDLRNAGQRLTADLVRPIAAEARRIAHECADRISPASASGAELAALSSLYLYSADTAKAKDIAGRALAKPGQSDADRADALIAAEQLAIATFDPFAGFNSEARQDVSEIGRLPDTVSAKKNEADHGRLNRDDCAA